MNTKITKSNIKDLNEAEIVKIADELHLHKRLIELLFSRGIDNLDSILKFLNPSEEMLNDPFSMKNMDKIVSRIKSAIQNREKLIVYGDYDADGVCSAAILSLYFKSCGLDVIVHIPDRISDGYGLSVHSIETLIEKHCPDLIITCDCGISGIEEVNYCQDLGVDIIVTDHHEPGAKLPDCLILNPKQAGDEYKDKYLCGAGVALKLVQALCGDSSYREYLDLAAIATIADLVPLLGENRLIVQLGLRVLTDGICNKGLKKLLKLNGIDGEVTSSDIAFKIAPRINAAGRMGDAYRAFELLTTTDESKMNELCADIESDNERRKKLCDTIYCEAETDLRYEDLHFNRAIILCNPDWAKGVTGIAAARFVGDYNRPAFIIVDKNDSGIYKGTARGIKGINIYEALAYCGDLLEEYGGHTGAAGFSIKEDNIEAFKHKMNEYMEKQPEELFLPSATYDIDVDIDECNRELYDELKRIEPTGHANSKPLFRVKTNKVVVQACKNPSHSSIKLNNLQTYAFNFFKRNQYLLGDNEKEIVIELTEGIGGSVSGYIKAVSTDSIYINDELALANFAAHLLIKCSKKPVYKTYNCSRLKDLLPKSIYGTLFICADRESYNKVCSLNGKFVTHDYMYKAEKNNYSGILVSPAFCGDNMLGNYSEIVFVDKPLTLDVVSFLNEHTDAEIYLPEENNDRILSSVSADREVFATYYTAIVNHKELASGNPMIYYKRLCHINEKLQPLQFIVCLAVFMELGFVKISNDKVQIVTGVKKSLDESSIYAMLKGNI